MCGKKLVVNATALDRSGALSILCQFIESIPEDDHQWLIFIPHTVSITTEKSNVRLEPISNVKHLHRRVWWDAWGLKRWLKKHDIEAVAAISLQNTGFSVGRKVPSFLYYHQSIPFYPYSWNPFKKCERTFWFYKNIYPFFVKLFLKNDTRVFVQLDFIKEGFSDFFRHPKELIDVYSPKVLIPEAGSLNIEKHEPDNDAIKLFYPAMNHFYKNHRVITDSLRALRKNVEIYFTVDKTQDFPDDDRVRYIGILPYVKVCEMYGNCDALLFPSYIETYGLPLIEAALTGMPIIAADLPYSREVLNGYDGVTFIEHDKPELWSNAIMQLKKRKRFKPIDISNRPGWPELFDNIISKIE